MLFIARLWWLALKRKWRTEIHLLFTLVGISALHGGHTLFHPAAAGWLYFSSLFGIALLAALVVPVLAGSENVLSSPRVRLLPLTPGYFFLLRVMFGNPLRILLALSALGWGLAGSTMTATKGVHAGVAAVQLLAWTTGAVVGMQLLEDTLGRRVPSLFAGVSMYLSASVMQLLVLYASLYEHLAAFEAYGPVPLWNQLLFAAIGLAITAGLTLLAHRVSERHAHPAAAGPRAGMFRPISFLAAWLTRRAPALLAKELAVVLRPTFHRVNLIFTAGIALAAFVLHLSWLLPLAAGIWVVFAHNALGPDLPHGGTLRYALLPIPLERILQHRHVAMLVVASGCILIGAAVAALISGWGVGLSQVLAAYLFGMAYLLMSTVPGDWISIRYPREVKLRYELEGGTKYSPAAWFSISAVTAVASAVVGTALLLLHMVLDLSGTTLVTCAFWLSTVACGALYAARHYLRRASGTPPDDAHRGDLG